MTISTFLLRLFLLLLLALSPASLIAAPDAGSEERYPVISWTDLIPEDDLDALLNPPEYLDDIPEGSTADELGDSKTIEGANTAEALRYQQALVSKRVRKEFDNRRVKVPGFVVPLAFDEQMVVTEFFLVPFFGACIHVPPPPPNQMIHVEYQKGLTLESLYDPFYVEGTLKIKSVDGGDMGVSAYSMTVKSIQPYSE